MEKPFSPWGEFSLVPHEDEVISYTFFDSYHPLRAHLLGSDWMLDSVFSDDVAPCLYGEAILCPSPHSFAIRPLTSLTFPPPYPYLHRMGLLYWYLTILLVEEG